MKYKLLLTAAAVTVLGASLLSTSPVFAQEAATDNNPMASLAQRIADKFGLDKTEVQAVFDQAQDEALVNHEQKFVTRLDQAVSEGKLTAAQKEIILAKRQELEKARTAQKEALKNKTKEELKTEFQTQHDALKAWAEQNNIDMQYLMPMGLGKGPGRPGFHGGQPLGEAPITQ